MVGSVPVERPNTQVFEYTGNVRLLCSGDAKNEQVAVLLQTQAESSSLLVQSVGLQKVTLDDVE